MARAWYEEIRPELGERFARAIEAIREMARVLGKLPADQRPWALNYEKPMSAYEYYDHDPVQASSPNVIRMSARPFASFYLVSWTPLDKSCRISGLERRKLS